MRLHKIFIGCGCALALLFPTAVLSEESTLDVLTTPYTYTYAGTGSQADTFRGQFRPLHHTVLSAGIDGHLRQFDVKTGSIIKRGDLIARFSCSEEEAEHEIAVAKVKVASKNVEVNKKLDAYQNISELDLSKSIAELEISNAEAGRTKAVVNKCTIRAPFDATVTEKLAQAYQYVKKGDPLLEIVDTRNLEIEMVLPSVDVVHYEAGKEFTILVDETGLEVAARIDRVVNVIDPVSQTIRVIGTLVESTPGLMPGMSGIVHFR